MAAASDLADMDERQLASWLMENAGLTVHDLRIRKFPGGQSNPTYLLQAQDKKFVLRRKPYGVLLPSAHAVEREFRVLAALHPLEFPVPAPVVLCDDESVIGSVFYIMEHVEGRSFWDGRLPQLDRHDRRQVYQNLVSTLAQLHAVDPATAGLTNFGRPGSYFERQISRWSRQYKSAETEYIGEMDRLIEWLENSAPKQSGVCLIHGDYRLDNVIFSRETPDVSAVIDWELATLGDPLADFTYFAMNWIMPVDGKTGLCGIDHSGENILSLDEICQQYMDERGIGDLPDLHWYFSYNLFRLSSIVQGIRQRALNGNASNAEAEKTGELVRPFAEAAWQQARLAGAR